jgi:hypothetical protein
MSVKNFLTKFLRGNLNLYKNAKNKKFRGPGEKIFLYF